MFIRRVLAKEIRQKCSTKLKSSRFMSQTCEKEEIKPKDTEVKQQRRLLDGPSLKDFFTKSNLQNQESWPEADNVPYLQDIDNYGERRKVFFDVYGCQMNVNDSEIVWSILKANNFLKTDDLMEADVVLLVTCAIREGAEAKIWHRLSYLKALRNKRTRHRNGKPPMKIGLLGCMAERLKHKVLEKEQAVDIIAGPDSYKDLPRLLALTENNQTAVNVLLSLDETYADIMPVRLNENAISAFVSIMRGCDNMCSYCIVPFTRGRERSRPVESILNEVKQLSEQGVKEVTLLGQNVNSYRDLSKGTDFYTNSTNLAKGFRTVYKNKLGGLRFATLLDEVASIDPEMRIRFTSPHPKDFPDEVLHVIKARPNICKNMHLPAQAGNSNVLERMRRGYTRESYLELVNHVRDIIPEVALSSDFICGFCGETEEEFADTISLVQTVKFNMAYIFPYSMREKTTAHRRYQDNVPQLIKQKRMETLIGVYRATVENVNKAQIGQTQLVLVEGQSKRSKLHLQGRNDGNIKVIFPAGEIPQIDNNQLTDIKVGDYIVVHINAASSQVLKGIPLYHTTLSNFYEHQENPFDRYNDDYIKFRSFY